MVHPEVFGRPGACFGSERFVPIRTLDSVFSIGDGFYDSIFAQSAWFTRSCLSHSKVLKSWGGNFCQERAEKREPKSFGGSIN